MHVCAPVKNEDINEQYEPVKFFFLFGKQKEHILHSESWHWSIFVSEPDIIMEV